MAPVRELRAQIPAACPSRLVESSCTRAGVLSMTSIWAELRRRKVVKVLVAYVIVAWLTLQISSVLVPLLSLPQWSGRLVFLLLVVGFPLAAFFAWAYDLTPEGLKRQSEVDSGVPITRQTGRKLDYLIIAVLGIAVISLVGERLFRAEEGTTPNPAVTVRSVAVLPFVDMSPDKDQEYFSAGISEDILNQLSRIPGLLVAGRTSSFAFGGKNQDLREIGEKLNVAYILEGSIQKTGEKVRVTVQLIKAADGYNLWSDRYDRNLTDIFAIQDEIAKAVASAMSITLGVGEGDPQTGGTQSFDAYDAYLAGVSLFRQNESESTVQAIQLLEKAVALDPRYARAWSTLAFAYGNTANSFVDERTEELYQKSQDAAVRAIEIAPNAVASLQAAAYVQMRNRDWIGAEQSLTKALRLAPSDYEVNLNYGQFLLRVGKPKEAIGYFRPAAKLEPLLYQPILMLVWAHEIGSDFDLAMRELDQGRDLIGAQVFRQLQTAVIGMETHDRSLIVQASQDLMAEEAVPDSTALLTRTMLSLLDAPEAARSRLHEFHEDPDFGSVFARFGIAVWASYFGDPELALATYRELFEVEEPNIFMVWRPIEEKTRRLPGFADLVQELGLVNYWRSTDNWGDFCQQDGGADVECQ